MLAIFSNQNCNLDVVLNGIKNKRLQTWHKCSTINVVFFFILYDL